MRVPSPAQDYTRGMVLNNSDTFTYLPQDSKNIEVYNIGQRMAQQ